MQHTIGEIFQAEQGCMLCSGHQRQVIALKGRHEQALTTVICTGCGLVHSHPIPSERALREYYRQAYRQEYKSTYRPKRKHILRYSRNAIGRLQRLAHFARGGALLDVGCGSGEFVYLAQKAGFQSVGLEPHEAYSAYTRAMFDVPILTASIDEAQIAPDSFDVVTIHHVVEHLPNPVASLRTIRGWLRPGGVLAIDVPDMDNVPRALTHHFHEAHIYNFNYCTLRALLEKAGFEVQAHPSYRATILFARKTDHLSAPLTAADLAQNYAQLIAKLVDVQEEKQRRSRSFKRLLRKCYRYPLEYVMAWRLRHPRRIADTVFARAKWRSMPA